LVELRASLPSEQRLMNVLKVSFSVSLCWKFQAFAWN